MGRLTVFLDDGGVMNDNQRRGPAWQRLVGEFFTPRLGGDPDAWGMANRVVAERQWDAYARTMYGRTDGDVAAFVRANQIEWLAGMCALVGVPTPPDDECLALAQAASAIVTPRVDAACAGAVAAIRQLHLQGYVLNTASGGSMAELHGYLTGMGVRDLFGRLYGTDLINTFKEGPAYYTRMLADAGLAPHEALIVDDMPRAVAWALQAGARAVLVGTPTAAPPGAHAINALADLPGIIATLADDGAG